MALKFVLDAASFDALSDDIKKLYTKRDDGKYQLEAEGVADKAKLEEFRANNINLQNKLNELTEKFKAFEGIDPDKYKTFMEKFQSDEEKKLMKEGNIEEVVKLRTAAIVKDRDDQLAAKEKIITKLTDDAKKATQEKDTYIVETELRKAVDNPEFGFHPGVSDIIKESVLKEFVHKDGKVVRVKPDGSHVFGKNGDPMGLGEYVSGFAKEHPYLVKASGGGGARNDTANGNGNGTQKTMKRADFEKLGAVEKSKFTLTEKGVLVD